MNRLEQIRENEKQSHIDAYSHYGLYQEGSWLKKPVKTVLDLLPYFESYRSLRVLDLGCGVGRNCIAIARQFSNIACRIDCVDILEMAIEKLTNYAVEYGVSESIHGYVLPIETFPIPENTYDLILAISALEHVDTEESLVRTLMEMKTGLKEKGIVCLVMNTSVCEWDKQTRQELPAQFEVNMKEETLRTILEEIFCGWTVLKSTTKMQRYDIPRGAVTSDLHTQVVTLVARKDV